MANKDNLIEALSEKIKNFNPTQEAKEAGVVTVIGDGIAIIEGLETAMLGEVVLFPGKTAGLILNLNKDTVGAIILGDQKHLKEGDVVYRTGQLLTMPASNDMIGRIIDPLGNPLDGKGTYKIDAQMPIDKVAPGVMERASVNQPMQTGVKAIDSMIPIGRGQRELIIGDRSTGKTAIALSTIINQKGDNMICIYCSVGSKRASVAQVMGTLEKYGCFEYTTIIAATASDPASTQFLAPYSATALAEYYADKGKDVLVVYDDLTKHAWAYRELSLLLRRPSGREAYPGDVFYLHSRLLERSVKFNKANGGGSITSLPVIETQANDVSAYIPTNVISITDGQIFLEADMFNAGQRPAVNLGISVSRVGSSAQIKATKQVVGSLKLDMAQYRDLAAFAQFSSDLDPKTKAQIDRGKRITEILKQGAEEAYKVEDQIIVFWAANEGYINTVNIDKVKEWEYGLLEYVKANHKDIQDKILAEKKMTDDIVSELHKVVKKFNDSNPNLMDEVEE